VHKPDISGERPAADGVAVLPRPSPIPLRTFEVPRETLSLIVE